MRLLKNLVLSALLLLPLRAALPQSFQVEFIGEADFPTGFRLDSLELGGLSGITYDAKNDRYFCISDDYSDRGAARFFTFAIDLTDGRLDSGDVKPTGVRVLLDKNGKPFVRTAIDGEGIAFSRAGALYISSEGSKDTRFQPFIRKMSLQGAYLGELALPAKLLPTPERDYGIRANRGPECLGLTADEHFLFTGIEQALSQDGPETDLRQASPGRILRFDLQRGGPPSEFLYWVDPVVKVPVPPDAPRDNGLTDLLPLSPEHLLGLERSNSRGVGNAIRLYEISLQGATDISGIDSLAGRDLSRIKPAKKTLVFDFLDLGIYLDNIEGLVFGPRLADGRRSLIVVSDNNFNEKQKTQFFAFAVADSSETYNNLEIHDIQGRGHASPFRGSGVANVRGIVTAGYETRHRRAFWLQSRQADSDVATSEGIFVVPDKSVSMPHAGDEVEVSGKVKESMHRRELGRTQILAGRIVVAYSDNPLPPAVLIGAGGRKPPSKVVDDDGLSRFQPEQDGIDFYESLEGMRVEIRNPVIVGPRNRFGECVVLADEGKGAGLRTAGGGILLRQEDPNPERVVVSGGHGFPLPNGNVGDHFIGTITGVLDYSFGNYKIVVTDPLPPLLRLAKKPEGTRLRGGKEWLTVGTYNVENLDFLDKDSKYTRLAHNIVDGLAAPDIIGLQEVQDDTGPKNDGTVSADKTLKRLVNAVREAGGPAYRFCQIDPEDKKDGGQPGGNIRVAFLYNPKRVTFKRRGKPGPLDAAALDEHSRLRMNPARVSPGDAAFAHSRKPLAGGFSFNGHALILVDCHLNSKGGDAGIFGAEQPPQPRSEAQRTQQAGVLRAFIADIFERDSSANVIVLGDMNEYGFRRPMRILAAGGLQDLVASVPKTERYTYIYQGNSQAIDHVFVSRSLAQPGTFEADVVHLNAGFAHNRRASDHDPVVVRLRLRE